MATSSRRRIRLITWSCWASRTPSSTSRSWASRRRKRRSPRSRRRGRTSGIGPAGSLDGRASSIDNVTGGAEVSVASLRSDRVWWRQRDALWLLAPALLYLAVFSIFPLFYSLWASLNDWDKRALRFTFIGLGNYQELLHDELFWQSLATTAI